MRTRIFTALRLALLLSLFLLALAVQAEGPKLQEAPTRPMQLEPPPPCTGFIPPSIDLSHLTGQRMPEKFLSQQLPSSWDWRAQGKVTPVKDQGPCGSCYAFAAVGNVESKLLMDGAGTYDLSENNAKECNWDELAGTGASCDGGNYDMIANLFSQKGTVLESCDPYVPSDVACNSTCPYQQTLLDWRIISDSVPDPDVLKSYIYNYGPVYTTIYASFPGFSWYDGSYTIYYPGWQWPDHAVVIVGWDDSLTHAGGTGGWIVKNSWGTGWGGPCGYGTEGGYFTIAYGSANIGMYSSFMYDWQDYDTSGDVLYYDEGGNSTAWGCGTRTAWGLVRFIPAGDMTITRVEFWTMDATSDVDVYLYDNFDGTAPSNLLAQKLNNSFDEAGYHSVELSSPLAVSSGDDIIAVVKFTNVYFIYPVVADWMGPSETGRTYISCDGSSGSWTDLGVYAHHDVAIRLRATNVTAGGFINFDDVVAPCHFDQTVPLRNRYAAQGVWFWRNAGGGILNECGDFFGVTGHSSPNFLAFDHGASFQDGSTPAGPEFVFFWPLADYVEVVGGKGGGATGWIWMLALDYNYQVVGFDYAPVQSQVQPMSISAPGILLVVLGSTSSDGAYIFDDLGWHPMWVGNGVEGGLDIDALAPVLKTLPVNSSVDSLLPD